MPKPRSSSLEPESSVLTCQPSIAVKILWPKPLWHLCFYPTIVYPAYQYWRLKTTRHILSTQRLISVSGVIFKEENSLELYRIRDCRIRRGPVYQSIDLWLRLWGNKPLVIGDIYIYADDFTHPVTILEAIPNALWVKEQIRKWAFDDKLGKGVLFKDS
ncbi:MAG: PH domain-containing protein [Cyanosarcina radialis HA8281-LM2]|jgi:hypothetical protein|nr:PH domain-containing protein [Cyanosarcina radialis HA8281-LM2]